MPFTRLVDLVIEVVHAFHEVGNLVIEVVDGFHEVRNLVIEVVDAFHEVGEPHHRGCRCLSRGCGCLSRGWSTSSSRFNRLAAERRRDASAPPRHDICQETAPIRGRWEYVSADTLYRVHIVMSARPIGAAPAKRAKNSRREGLRSCGLRRERRQSWIRPYRRTRRAIDVSLRLIESAGRVIDACDNLAADHPLLVTRQLQRVYGWLDEVNQQLGHGVEGLRATTDHVALAPAYAADAPRLLIDATVRWIGAAAKLAALSDRLDGSWDALVAYVKGGKAPLDLSELFRKPGPAPKRICFVVRRPSLKFLSCESRRVFCIHVRRQRSARLTVAEAPRRISRGRAPPSVSTCSL